MVQGCLGFLKVSRLLINSQASNTLPHPLWLFLLSVGMQAWHNISYFICTTIELHENYLKNNCKCLSFLIYISVSISIIFFNPHTEYMSETSFNFVLLTQQVFSWLKAIFASQNKLSLIGWDWVRWQWGEKREKPKEGCKNTTCYSTPVFGLRTEQQNEHAPHPTKRFSILIALYTVSVVILPSIFWIPIEWCKTPDILLYLTWGLHG